MRHSTRIGNSGGSNIWKKFNLKRCAWFCGASLMIATPLVIVSSGMVTATHALDNESAFATTETAADSQPGLQGILPSVTPEDISYEGFAVLDKNWADWSEQTSNLIVQFYEETPDLAGQKMLISQLNQRLAVMEKSIADQRYRSIHDSLIDLHGKLKRRLTIAQAIIDTLEASPQVSLNARLEEARQLVVDRYRAVDDYLNSIQNGNSWIAYTQVNHLNELRENETAHPAMMERLLFVNHQLASTHQLSEPLQREFLAQPVFVDLSNSLENYLALANATILPADSEELRSQLAELVSALEEYELNAGKASAETVRNVYSTLKGLCPDGGKIITAALRRAYFNYNLKIAASEKFLKHVIAEEREEDGDVIDCILGAYVTGEQTTVTEIGIDLLPHDEGIRFDIVVDGVVNSNTAGEKGQATIYTQGYHVFEARKEIIFKNEEFYSSDANIAVSANNDNFDADTPLSGLPILRALGRSVALMEAERKRPAAESIAASRVEDRVLPRLDEEVDNQFATASTDMQQKLFQKLRDNNLYPSASRYASTETHALISQRLMSVGELGGSIAPAQFDSEDGLVIQIHESNMNNALDRLNLAGRTMTEDELRTELEQHFSDMLGKTVTFPKPEAVEGEEPGPNTLVFANIDPIRVNISAGVFSLILRTGFKQEDKEDIPTQEITIPMSFTLTDDQILLQRGVVAVAPVDQPESVAKQLAQAGVIRKKLDSSLPDRQFDRQFKIERKNDRPALELQVTTIKPLDGWLTIVIE